MAFHDCTQNEIINYLDKRLLVSFFIAITTVKKLYISRLYLELFISLHYCVNFVIYVDPDILIANT